MDKIKHLASRIFALGVLFFLGFHAVGDIVIGYHLLRQTIFGGDMVVVILAQDHVVSLNDPEKTSSLFRIYAAYAFLILAISAVFVIARIRFRSKVENIKRN